MQIRRGSTNTESPPVDDDTERIPIQIRRGSTNAESPPVDDDTEQFPVRDGEELTGTDFSQDVQPAVTSSRYEDPLRYEDPVMQISGTGHWFLEGWIGDHSVEFLVDSGSSVTAMSDTFYRNLVYAGAPLGVLQVTARTLCSANGTGIEVLGCSRCSVSFLGLRTEFPIIICNLATGTDAIIGTDVLGSSPGVQFRPGNSGSGSIHGSRNDHSGDRYTVCGGRRDTATGCDRRAALPSTGFDRPDVRRLGCESETPAGGSFVGICRHPSCTGRPSYRSHGCDINTGDRPPIRCAPRRMSPQKMKKEEECVTEMLTGGQIEASDSPWSSPVVLVMKKDGGTRFCIDYRQLNDATIKDTYPLPRIDDTLDMLAGKQWFSTLDLASGYWQVSLSQEARVKTAFATHSGLFQFRVMPFGLCNAPATFERLMDRVLQGLRWSRCLVYLDDIISFGGTFDGALTNLTLIFERLRSYGLQLKLSKCHLFRASVPFLGHIVGQHGRCEVVASSGLSEECTPVFGVCGVLSTIHPEICRRGDAIGVFNGQGCAFCVGLRAALMDAPILAFPTETGLYVLDTDASNFGLGGVLSQIQNDQERVVAYCSRALRPSQRRYCTTKQEMLAAVAMCIQSRSYLRGARFTLRTDHKPLVCCIDLKIQRA